MVRAQAPFINRQGASQERLGFRIITQVSKWAERLVRQIGALSGTSF